MKFLGRYLWGVAPGIAKRHFTTAKVEHEDLSNMAQIFNNVEMKAIPLADTPRIEKDGMNWRLCIPCQAGEPKVVGKNNEVQVHSRYQVWAWNGFVWIADWVRAHA